MVLLGIWFWYFAFPIFKVSYHPPHIRNQAVKMVAIYFDSRRGHGPFGISSIIWSYISVD